jgi:hypothetical protein
MKRKKETVNGIRNTIIRTSLRRAVGKPLRPIFQSLLRDRFSRIRGIAVTLNRQIAFELSTHQVTQSLHHPITPLPHYPITPSPHHLFPYPSYPLYPSIT